MITEDYCSRDIYRLLIKKGFDGEIHTSYDKEGYTQPSITHQTAMKWLREVHHIIFVFKPSYFSGDEWWTYERWCGDNFDGEVLSFKTYEEAVESALKYCLENLI